VRLLLDTHLLLWAAAKSRRLPRAARALVEDSSHEIFWSAASLWEIAIKLALGRPGLDVEMEALRPAFLEMGFEELPVRGAHAERLLGLPPLHKDPFDRMLVAQSLSESLRLLTNDGLLAGYSDTVIVVEE
jgi:PIN domain nuclease of toxin-antitoxin system